MRNLNDVINNIIKISTNADLIDSLKNIQYDLLYKAPELHYSLWDKVGSLLGIYYPNPIASEESLGIASIFTTKSKEELLNIYGGKI